MNETFHTDSLPGRTVTLADGREFLWFSGTDYLGMGHDETFQAHLAEGFRRYGTHYGSSRNGRLRLAVYEEVETSLAGFVGAPAALVVSSGMWAGQLIMKSLENLNARFHYAPNVHPALWGQDYAPERDSWGEWFRKTFDRIRGSEPEQPQVVCADSVGAPWVEEIELEMLSGMNGLTYNRDLWMVVDDSHGLGIWSKHGLNSFEQLPNSKRVHTIMTASLNKALGVPGGVIFGDRDFIQELRQLPWFAGSSPAAPAYFYALQQNLVTGLYQKAHDNLLANIQYFTKKLSQPNLLESIENYPVFCSRDPKLYPYLLENQILTSHFSYPKPTDPPIVRLVITASHQKEDLDHLAEVLSNFE